MSPPTVTVTGWDGFVGRHLVRELHARGAEVVGISLPGGGERVDEPLPGGGAVGGPGDAPAAPPAGPDLVVSADLTAGFPADAPVGDVVIHLAGLAAVRPSYSHPQRYIATNTAMLTHVGEALVRARRRVHLLVVSTGLVYGGSHEDAAGFTEDAALRPRSPYAVSKVAMEYQAGYYRGLGVDTTIIRPFNHLGPGQARGFLLPDLVAAVRENPDGRTLATGRLDTRRDYTDVRDIVSAYATLALSPSRRFGVYNVASGVGVSGTRMLTEVCRALGRPTPPVQLDPARAGAGGAAVVLGDSGRLRTEFGWVPSIPLEVSVRDFVASQERP